MCTRMTSQRLDAVEADLAAIKLALQSHESSISTQSSKLDSLVSSISELSKSISILCDEMHESRSSISDSPLRHAPDDGNLYLKRVDLLPFTGNNPIGWLAKMETYFSVQNTPPEMHISLAQICMEGMTRHWFMVLSYSNPHLIRFWLLIAWWQVPTMEDKPKEDATRVMDSPDKSERVQPGIR